MDIVESGLLYTLLVSLYSKVFLPDAFLSFGFGSFALILAGF